MSDLDPEETAGVVADPVVAEATRDHEIGSVGQVVAMLLGPIGLWLGAMALFLVFQPFTREALASTAPTGRLVARTLFRGSLVGLVQAAAVVVLMHTALGVEWALAPQTFAFSVLLAVAFMAVHAFLHSWLGRAGTIVSLVLVVLQLAGEGALSLDDTVEQWLPGVVSGNGNDGSMITIRQLLQHTSGIYNYIGPVEPEGPDPQSALAVLRSAERQPAESAAPVAAPAPDEARAATMLAVLRQVRAFVEENFENVGERFPEEARRIHRGETEERDIFGRASLKEAKELLEEGIAVHPLPDLPKLDG